MGDIKKILATTDLSDQSLPGVLQAASLARRLDARVALLYVLEDHLPPIIMFTTEEDRAGLLEEHRERAAGKLREYAESHLAGCESETAAVVGVADREIVRYAKENGVDLIVMASHGYGPVRQLVLGSTTERVLHHASCPVLVIPSKVG
jgi:nucleotide-binding universal stress UspA family protein